MQCVVAAMLPSQHRPDHLVQSYWQGSGASRTVQVHKLTTDVAMCKINMLVHDKHAIQRLLPLPAGFASHALCCRKLVATERGRAHADLPASTLAATVIRSMGTPLLAAAAADCPSKDRLRAEACPPSILGPCAHHCELVFLPCLP